MLTTRTKINEFRRLFITLITILIYVKVFKHPANNLVYLNNFED